MKYFAPIIALLISGYAILVPNLSEAAAVPGCAMKQLFPGGFCDADNTIPFREDYCGTTEQPGMGCCCTYEAQLKINSGEADAKESKKVEPSIFTPPKLSVLIPGLADFTKVQCDDVNTNCSIPWLGQYIAGLQRYALGIIGIIAVIVMMIAGIMWLTSAGNSEQVSQAQSLMKGAVLGLVIAFGAYLILYTINPNLTILKNINISYIGRIDLSEIELVNHDPQFDSANGKPINDATYDDTFKSMAGCIGIDWRVLKGIAFKESHLDPNVVNGYGYTGLFQTRPEFCVESVRHLGFSSAFCNPGIKDPAVNTAVATGMMKINLATINSTCGSASDSTKIFMIYYGHSSGGGALKKAIKNYGCNIGNWPAGKPPFNGATKDYVTNTVETVLGQGVTSITNTSQNKTCPQG